MPGLPWSCPSPSAFFQVLWPRNAGAIAWSRKALEPFCMAKTFVSHSWGEAFEDFALTLHRLLDEEAKQCEA